MQARQEIDLQVFVVGANAFRYNRLVSFSEHVSFE
jgi:hypothetical protein